MGFSLHHASAFVILGTHLIGSPMLMPLLRATPNVIEHYHFDC